MDDKVLGGQGPEKHIQVPPSQPQRLGAGSRELDIVAGRDRSTDAIHSALQDLVLQRERSCEQGKAGGYSRVPTGRFLRSRKASGPYRHHGHISLFAGPFPLIHPEVSEYVEKGVLPGCRRRNAARAPVLGSAPRPFASARGTGFRATDRQ